MRERMRFRRLDSLSMWRRYAVVRPKAVAGNAAIGRAVGFLERPKIQDIAN